LSESCKTLRKDEARIVSATELNYKHQHKTKHRWFLSEVCNDAVTICGFVIGILWNPKIHSCIRNHTERYREPFTTRPHPCNLISFTSVITLFHHQNLCLRQAKCHNYVTPTMHDTCTKSKAIPSLA